MSRTVKVYQTWDEEAGTADGVWHPTRKQAIVSLCDEDSGHDSFFELEVELTKDGITKMLNNIT